MEKRGLLPLDGKAALMRTSSSETRVRVDALAGVRRIVAREGYADAGAALAVAQRLHDGVHPRLDGVPYGLAGLAQRGVGHFSASIIGDLQPEIYSDLLRSQTHIAGTQESRASRQESRTAIRQLSAR